jgi:hypothetical protein
MKSLNRIIKTPNKKSSDLLEKLETIEQFHRGITKEEKKRVKKKADQPNHYEINYFQSLEERFSQYHFVFENNIKTTHLRTFGNYFEIFGTYAETLLAPFFRGGLEKNLRVEIKTELINQKLQFAMLIKNIKHGKEDSVLKDIRRSEKTTSHLLTPFRGRVGHFLKKSPNRQVKAVLVKMELTPLRQHIPNHTIINQ